MTSVRLEPAALRSRVKHSMTEPLCSQYIELSQQFDQGNFSRTFISTCIDKSGSGFPQHNYMGCGTRKPVFGTSDKVIPKPACSATKTSYKIESLVSSLDRILSYKPITKAPIRLCECAGWSVPLLFANLRRLIFSRLGPYRNT